MFRDRLEAGSMLAKKLKKYENEPGIILAIPRGGVPVAYEIVKELNFPIEIVLTKKIGHPQNKEYAIGAASLSDYFVIPHQNITSTYLEQELQNIRKRLKEMHEKFMGNKVPENLKGKTVIIIDDGIATGNTILSTINLLRKDDPAKIIVATPVAPQSAVQKLAKEADEIVTLITPQEFYGVGAFYNDFEQVTDREVIFYLDKLQELKENKA